MLACKYKNLGIGHGVNYILGEIGLNRNLMNTAPPPVWWQITLKRSFPTYFIPRCLRHVDEPSNSIHSELSYEIPLSIPTTITLSPCCFTCKVVPPLRWKVNWWSCLQASVGGHWRSNGFVCEDVTNYCQHMNRLNVPARTHKGSASAALPGFSYDTINP